MAHSNDHSFNSCVEQISSDFSHHWMTNFSFRYTWYKSHVLHWDRTPQLSMLQSIFLPTLGMGLLEAVNVCHQGHLAARSQSLLFEHWSTPFNTIILSWQNTNSVCCQRAVTEHTASRNRSQKISIPEKPRCEQELGDQNGEPSIGHYIVEGPVEQEDGTLQAL